jgi:hypothetical protein
VPDKGLGQTLLLNAAILTHGDAKNNAPIVVDMSM